MRLLFFKVNQLGDNVVFLPVVQALRKARPSWPLCVVTSPLAAPLYRVTCPDVDVLEYDTAGFNAAWKRPLSCLAMLKSLRQKKPQACLLANDQGNVAHLLAAFCGAALKVAPDLPDLLANRLIRHRVPLRPKDSAAMQNWRLAKALLAGADRRLLPDKPPVPDLSAFGRSDHGRVLIHAGASRAYQRWPLRHYIELANRLAETQAVLWIQQHDEAESALDPRIERAAPDSLAALIRLIAGCRAFIGNNSGPMHLASALGVPSVILIGPSALNWDPMWHQHRFDLLREPRLPCQPCDRFGRPAHVCQNVATPMACLERWTVTAVHERVQKWLQQVRP